MTTNTDSEWFLKNDPVLAKSLELLTKTETGFGGLKENWESVLSKCVPFDNLLLLSNVSDSSSGTDLANIRNTLVQIQQHRNQLIPINKELKIAKMALEIIITRLTAYTSDLEDIKKIKTKDNREIQIKAILEPFNKHLNSIISLELWCKEVSENLKMAKSVSDSILRIYDYT